MNSIAARVFCLFVREWIVKHSAITVITVRVQVRVQVIADEIGKQLGNALSWIVKHSATKVITVRVQVIVNEIEKQLGNALSLSSGRPSLAKTLSMNDVIVPPAR